MTAAATALPRVSICIPTYNGEAFLAQALESALAQTYPNLEILLSDDDSTDRTLAIAQAFQARSPVDFLILPHARLGLVENWNFCIEKASGKYIKFLFQDDTLEPTCVEEMVALAEQEAAIGLVFAKRHVLLAESAQDDPHCLIVYNGCQNVHAAWSTLERVQRGETLLGDPNLLEEPINKIGEPTAVLIRKEVFTEVGPFDPELKHLIDVDMWLRIMSRYHIGFIDRTLATFRLHPQQQTNRNFEAGATVVEGYRLCAKIIYHPDYRFANAAFKQRVSEIFDDRVATPLAELAKGKAYARHLETVIQKTQSELEATQTELTQTRNYFEGYTQHLTKRWQTTQATLDRTQATCDRAQAEARRAQDLLTQNRTLLAAMLTSKFWRLRQTWFKLKLQLGRAIEATDFSSFLGLAVPPPQLKPPANQSLDALKQELTQACQRDLQTFLDTLSILAFPRVDQPEVSVILVLYNRAELTLACLRSLLGNNFKSLEIILVDNASTDATPQLLQQIQGVTVIRNRQNLHYLRACNQAGKVAKGRYILFLNNDARLFPDSLTHAWNLMQKEAAIGAVGGKIILPDGTLQEAGSIIWRDGSCLGYGRGDNPHAPPYQFRRPVDYCSAAFLLTRRDLLMQAGGFDSAYAPAYYEETDYCVRLWEQGKSVIYDPQVVIQHYEFASSDSQKRAIALQAEHQAIFAQKHATWLAQQYEPRPENIVLARIARTQQRRILFIDDRVPHRYLGSGFTRANRILRLMVKLGYFVTVFPMNFAVEDWQTLYSDLPPEVEVIDGSGTARLQTLLQERPGFYHLIFVSRPHNMQGIKAVLTQANHPRDEIPIIYDAEALYCLRDVAQQKLTGTEPTPDAIAQHIAAEVAITQGSQCVIAVSEAERQHFMTYGCSSVYVLGHALEVQPTPNAFSDRAQLLFVGAIHDAHSPNADSVVWLSQKIFPLMQKTLGPGAELVIAGTNAIEAINYEIWRDGNPAIKVLGTVPDLTPLYNQARLFVAPTRYGAGIPHKVHEAAARGVPVVATSLIAQQLGWESEVDLLVADDTEGFAAACVRLYQDQDLWERLQQNALKRVQVECDPHQFEATLQRILADSQARE
ncbi:glycosyltransferase [Trichothermofontia sp.]